MSLVNSNDFACRSISSLDALGVRPGAKFESLSCAGGGVGSYAQGIKRIPLTLWERPQKSELSLVEGHDRSVVSYVLGLNQVCLY